MDSSEKIQFYGWIGDQISQLRKEKGISQTKLGEYIGLSRSSIVNIEKGRQYPPLDVIWAISRALNTPINNILPLENEYRKPLEEQIVQSIVNNNEIDEETKSTIQSFLKKL